MKPQYNSFQNFPLNTADALMLSMPSGYATIHPFPKAAATTGTAASGFANTAIFGCVAFELARGCARRIPSSGLIKRTSGVVFQI